VVDYLKFLFNDTLLDYLSARKLIYVPTYREMVYKAPKALQLATELLKLGSSENVFLHDFDTNGEVENISKPLAHASVLVNILNENLKTLKQFETDDVFKKEYLTKIYQHSDQIEFPLADTVIKELI